MAKRPSLKAKRLALRATPTLLTTVRDAAWSGGVLFVNVDSGPEAGCLALGPNVALQLFQALQSGLLSDSASPLARRSPPTEQPKQKEATP